MKASSRIISILLCALAVNCISAGVSSAVAADLFVYGVAVKPTKAGGDAWDFGGGPPDPFVVIKHMDKSSVTAFGKDRFEVQYSHRALRNIQVGDRIEVQVWDKDVANNDLVGKETIEVTRDVMQKGKFEVDFDQVERLILGFE